MKLIAVKLKNPNYPNSKVYNSKDYYYRTNFPVSVGDEVVVDTAPHGLQVALVVCACIIDLHLLKDMDKHKFVVQVVDKTEYNELVSREEKMKELESKLDAFVEADNRIRIYEFLAEHNPEIAKLLSDYKSML